MNSTPTGASWNIIIPWLKFQVDYLRGLITLECMTIGCIWVRYILNVRDFHRKAYRPDIYREEFVQMVCPENASALSEEVSVFLGAVHK